MLAPTRKLHSAILGAGIVGSVHALAVHRAGERLAAVFCMFADGVRAATIHAAVASSVLSGSWVDVKPADAHRTGDLVLEAREWGGGRQ